jgi:hypothetical protein
MDHLGALEFDQHYPVDYRASPEDWMNPGFAGKWRPSIFMPRWASRITLKITDVRVERLQDISEDSAMAEGAQKYGETPDGELLFDVGSYRYGFKLLWDSINAKRGYGWDANPYVWVIEFRRVEGGK